MIKCNVTMIGTVCRAAQVRSNKDGKPFVSLGVNVVIPAKSGINKTFEVGMTMDGNDASLATTYPVNSRVKVTGVLTFRKHGDALYLNMNATELASTTEFDDSIKGDIEFKGTVGKNVDTKTSKSGKPYGLFSAFSAEKDGDGFAYTWVRFMNFNEEQPDWLQPKSHIEVIGELSLGVYNDRLDISCRVTEVAPWDKQPYQPKS